MTERHNKRDENNSKNEGEIFLVMETLKSKVCDGKVISSIYGNKPNLKRSMCKTMDRNEVICALQHTSKCLNEDWKFEKELTRNKRNYKKGKKYFQDYTL